MSDTVYGAIGVLAYDVDADRVQCHACGQWLHKLTSAHLRRHGLTVPSYKERYGLSAATALETSRVTTLRRHNGERSSVQNMCPVGVDTLYGDIGILAYDELNDRIQCHACGAWYKKLTSFHLKRHGLSINDYKERYGLNVGTALEIPSITARRRDLAAQHLIPWPKGSQPPGWHPHPNVRRAEYLRTYHTPEHFAARAQRQRRYTDEEMLGQLRTAQTALGGVLTRYELKVYRRRGGVTCPSDQAAIKRFGSWQRVCELLGQPYRTERRPQPPGSARHWSEDTMLAALRELKARAGGKLTYSDLYHLRTGRKGKVGAFPSYKTVLDHFGSWHRVCALLEQATNSDSIALPH